MRIELMRIQKELTVLFGIGCEMSIGEYWEAQSESEGVVYHTSNMLIRKMTRYVEEHASLKKLIELPNKPDSLDEHNVKHWMRRIEILERIWNTLLELEDVLCDSDDSNTEKHHSELFIFTDNDSFNSKSLSERILFWLDGANKYGIHLAPTISNDSYSASIYFEFENAGEEGVLPETYFLMIHDVLELEKVIHERYLKFLKSWMKKSLFSLRNEKELDILFDETDLKAIYDRKTNFSSRQLSVWIDRVGKSKPPESLNEWYGKHHEGA